jgi:hypothetical protein
LPAEWRTPPNLPSSTAHHYPEQNMGVSSTTRNFSVHESANRTAIYYSHFIRKNRRILSCYRFGIFTLVRIHLDCGLLD